MASGFMLLVEFFADKVPWLDSAWDAVHAFIRVPAGALLAAGVFGADNATHGRGGRAAGRLARRHGPGHQDDRARGGQYLARAVFQLGPVVL